MNKFKNIFSIFLLVMLAGILLACETTKNDENFTVTFNTHEGSSVASVSVASGQLLPTITEPTRLGFNFDGWYLESTYTTVWKLKEDKVTKDITLHAKWAAKTPFKITFEVNGGNPLSQLERTEGSQIGNLPAATKTGYMFAGWFLDANFLQPVVPSALVTADIKVYAKFDLTVVNYTVTFNAGLGEVLPETLTVPSDTLISKPAADYSNHSLIGWFKDAEFKNEFNFLIDKITSNITLYAKWEVIPEGKPISSQDQFYNLVNGTTTYEANDKFYLVNDLDFTGFNWDGSLFTEDPVRLHSFHFNGNNKTISNITFESPAQAGLFPRLSGGSITNLKLDNIHTKGATQGAVLVGRILNGSTVLIKDITITNSSVVTSAVGTGSVIGHVQGAQAKSNVTLENIIVLNTKVSSNSNSVGGVIGDVESSEVTIKNALVDVVVKSTAERVGGVIGEVRRNGSSQTIPKITIDAVTIYANLEGTRYLGTVIGRADNNLHNVNTTQVGIMPLEGSISNIIMVANFNAIDATNSSNGHISRFNAPTTTNAYMYAFNYSKQTLNSSNVTVNNTQHTYQPNNVDADKLFSSVEDFKTTHASGFDKELWIVKDGELPIFKGVSIDLGYKVIIEKNETEKQVQYVRHDETISPIYYDPTLGVLVNYYKEKAFTNVVEKITSDITVYPLIAPKYDVVFNTNGGTTVSKQAILSGQKAMKPADPTKELYTFGGWFVDEALETPYLFTEEVTTALTLYAKWTDTLSPTASFMTVEGKHLIAPDEAFEIIIKIEDASLVDIILNVGATNKINLTTLEAKNETDLAPFKTQADKDYANELGLVVIYNSLNKQISIIGTPRMIETLWDEVFEIELVLTDQLLNPSVTIKRSFELEIITTTFEVIFIAEGLEIPKQNVLSGQKANLPKNLHKQGYEFKGWYTDQTFDTLFNEETVITENITLYAKFEEVSYIPEGIAISTTEEFYNFAIGSADYSLEASYYLANDLDFSDYNWVWVAGKVFKGVLDGNFKSIKNLTIEASTDRIGIFTGLNGATFKNITLDNVDISSTVGARAGLFAGEAVSAAVTFDNIHLLNNKVVGGASNGTGSLVGYLNIAATVTNISIDGGYIENKAQATGGLFGRVGDGSALFNLTVSDIYIKNTQVKGTTRVGGLFGENNGAAGFIDITLSRVIIMNAVISGTDNIAGISGRHQPNPSETGTMIDVYVGANITGTKDVNQITTSRLYKTLTNVHFKGTVTGPINGTAALNVLTEEPTETWWNDNFESLKNSNIWTFNEEVNHFVLINSQA